MLNYSLLYCLEKVKGVLVNENVTIIPLTYTFRPRINEYFKNIQYAG